eukprot:SAG11_NODE_7289_length_1165_cov_16.045966_1_plen_88_part_01
MYAWIVLFVLLDIVPILVPILVQKYPGSDTLIPTLCQRMTHLPDISRKSIANNTPREIFEFWVFYDMYPPLLTTYTRDPASRVSTRGT